jgi:ABC-type multidrug transport system ATPase subunit
LPRVSSVVFEHANLYSRFSGRDNLRFFAALYRVEPERVDAVLATVGLERAWRRARSAPTARA